MKKTIILLMILLSSLYGGVTNEYPSQKIINSKIPVVDVRTPGEWRETGLLKGAIPIMFFNERGGYDVEGFLKQLQAKVDTTKPFALICRTGSRTKVIANYLGNQLGYNVVNLEGGMMYVKARNLPTIPYK